MRLVIIIVFILTLAGTAYAEPEIKFTTETYDMGNVSQDAVMHSFEFENTGSSELVIERILTS